MKDIDKIKSCELCGYSRYLEKCHIIPSCFDLRLKAWKLENDNFLVLCANCHRLFDQGKLTLEEYTKIEWQIKGVIKIFFPNMIKWLGKVGRDVQEYGCEGNYIRLLKGVYQRYLKYKIEKDYFDEFTEKYIKQEKEYGQDSRQTKTPEIQAFKETR